MPLLLTMGPPLAISAVIPAVFTGDTGSILLRTHGAVGGVTLSITATNLDGDEWEFTDNADGTGSYAYEAETAGVFYFIVRAVDSTLQPVEQRFRVRVLVRQPVFVLTETGDFLLLESGDLLQIDEA